MVNADTTRRIGLRIIELRPDWSEGGTLNAVQKLAQKWPNSSDDEILAAATRAALDPNNRTPSMIETQRPQTAAWSGNSEHAGEPLDPTECGHMTLMRRCAICRRDNADLPGYRELNERLREQGFTSGRLGNHERRATPEQIRRVREQYPVDHTRSPQ